MGNYWPRMNTDKQKTRKDKMEFGFMFGFIRVYPRSSVAKAFSRPFP
jgi:hypothetical protein